MYKKDRTNLMLAHTWRNTLFDTTSLNTCLFEYDQNNKRTEYKVCKYCPLVLVKHWHTILTTSSRGKHVLIKIWTIDGNLYLTLVNLDLFSDTIWPQG